MDLLRAGLSWRRRSCRNQWKWRDEDLVAAFLADMLSDLARDDSIRMVKRRCGSVDSENDNVRFSFVIIFNSCELLNNCA